ncbi:MAG: ABC transporter ATP-binding protein [Christensenellaceae bacterium]|nr:ABC transporter ATP-binding protein [Christensenellaceae bacterium]
MKIFIKKANLLLVCSLGIISNSSAILFSLSLMKIIDNINGSKELLRSSIIVAIGFLLLNILLNTILTIIKNKYTATCSANIKASLVNAICQMRVSEFAKRGNEYYKSFFINDLKVLEEHYIRKVLDVITYFSQFILSIAAIALLEPVFLLLPLGVVLLSVIIPVIFKGIVQKHNGRYSETNSKFLTLFEEILSGLIVIKNFSIAGRFTERVNKSIINAENSYAAYLNSMSLANIVFAFTGQLLLLSAFAIGGPMAASGTISAGSIVSLSQLLVYIIEPLAIFAGAATSYASVRGTLTECAEILANNRNTDNPESNCANDSLQLEGDISLKNLSIKNPETDAYVLNEITLLLRQGKKYALIGKNGSGKSTLLKAISRICIDYSGGIYYNGIDIRDISDVDLNSVVTYSPQDNFVFSMKLGENIFLAKPEQSWATQYLRKLKLSIDMNQSISSHEISGGERAKICLLRSIIKASPYLFLDEPTAAMDEESCNAFDEIICSLNSVLCVVVTHRIDSSLRNYDGVIVLDKGGVVAMDHYDNLLKSGIIEEDRPND